MERSAEADGVGDLRAAREAYLAKALTPGEEYGGDWQVGFVVQLSNQATQLISGRKLWMQALDAQRAPSRY